MGAASPYLDKDTVIFIPNNYLFRRSVLNAQKLALQNYYGTHKPAIWHGFRRFARSSPDTRKTKVQCPEQLRYDNLLMWQWNEDDGLRLLPLWELRPWKLRKRRRREEEGVSLAKFIPLWCILIKANIPWSDTFATKAAGTVMLCTIRKMDCPSHEEAIALHWAKPSLAGYTWKSAEKVFEGQQSGIKRCLYTSQKICSVRFTEHGHYVTDTI